MSDQQTDGAGVEAKPAKPKRKAKVKRRRIGVVTRRPKHLNPAGRPTILTPALIEGIAAKVADGVSIGTAATMFSISRSTANAWYERGCAREDDSLECRFACAIDKARASCVEGLVCDVRQAGHKGQWQASRYLLSTLEPDVYADVRRVEHSGSIDSRSTIVSLNLTAPLGDDQAATLASVLLRAMVDRAPAPVAIEAGG